MYGAISFVLRESKVANIGAGWPVRLDERTDGAAKDDSPASLVGENYGRQNPDMRGNAKLLRSDMIHVTRCMTCRRFNPEM
jgi:hypothetical protein